MPVPTTPLPIRGAVALLMGLGLLAAPVTALAQTPEAQTPLRACSGDTLTLAWGAIVRDSRGRCRAATRGVQAQRPVARAQVTAGATTACPNRRSYMGGALLICDDQPRASAPR